MASGIPKRVNGKKKTSEERLATSPFLSTIRDATKMKARMLKLKVHSARVQCPECVGVLHARLVGPKNHMRFWCDGPCKRRMME